MLLYDIRLVSNEAQYSVLGTFKHLPPQKNVLVFETIHQILLHLILPPLPEILL